MRASVLALALLAAGAAAAADEGSPVPDAELIEFLGEIEIGAAEWDALLDAGQSDASPLVRAEGQAEAREKDDE
jgi:hypothetical protein